jgi:hypothetical protein
MTLRSESDASPDEEFEPCRGLPKPPVSDRVADALQSHLIRAFETAIDQGMQPAEALGVILSWVSSETARLQPRKGRSPAR